MDGSRRCRPGAEPALSGWSVALLAVALVVYGNVIASPLLPEWVVLFANLAVGLTVVLAMRAFRYSLAEIGLSKQGWHRGWKWGVLVSAVVVAVVAIAAGPADRFTAVPAARGMTLGVLGWQVLIRIPIGTALFEEAMFRGVLYAAWHRVMRSWQAACLSSAAFAFWHVVAEMHRQERQGHAARTSASGSWLPSPIWS